MPTVRNVGKVPVSLCAANGNGLAIDRVRIDSGKEVEVESRFFETKGAANLLAGSGPLRVITEDVMQAEALAAEAQASAVAASSKAAEAANEAAATGAKGKKSAEGGGKAKAEKAS